MKLKSVIKFLTARAFEGLVAVILITIMPNIPPDAKFSKPYSVSPFMPLADKLAVNERLSEVEIWHKGEVIGPEAFAEYDGNLYTSLLSDVVKLTGDHITHVVRFGKPCKGIYQEDICGRPLGLTFDKTGALYVADAYYGLFKVDIKTGKKLQLVSMDQEINGKKPKLPNSVKVASNGDLYWTDSSTEFLLLDGLFDMLADGSGRLIHYDAKTKKNTVLLDDLHFANGVILADDESFVLVSETARNRIHRIYLKGPKKGTHDIFLDGLPGLPDNLNSDGQGGFLIPLVSAGDSEHPVVFQIFGPFPTIRKFFARIFGLVGLSFKIVDQIYPNTFAEQAVHFVGHFKSCNIFVPRRVTILHVSKTGQILDSLHTSNKKILHISEAFIFKDYLYLGSPHNDYIGRISLDKAGLKHLSSSTPTTLPMTSSSSSPTTTSMPKTTTPSPTTATPPPTTTTPTPKTISSSPITTPPPSTIPKTTPPSSTTTTPSPTTTTPSPTTTRPRPITTTPTPKTSSSPTTTLPTSTTPKTTPPSPTTTTPSPTRTPPSPTTSPPSFKTTSPSPTTTRPSPTTTTPSPTTTTPSPTTTTPSPATTRLSPTTTKSSPTTTPPSPTTTTPSTTTRSPPTKTTLPSATTTTVPTRAAVPKPHSKTDDLPSKSASETKQKASSTISPSTEQNTPIVTQQSADAQKGQSAKLKGSNEKINK